MRKIFFFAKKNNIVCWSFDVEVIGGCLEEVCYVGLSLHVLVAMESWRAEDR